MFGNAILKIILHACFDRSIQTQGNHFIFRYCLYNPGLKQVLCVCFVATFFLIIIRSPEWNKLKTSDREKLGIVFEDDGEFW